MEVLMWLESWKLSNWDFDPWCWKSEILKQATNDWIVVWPFYALVPDFPFTDAAASFDLEVTLLDLFGSFGGHSWIQDAGLLL